MNEKKTFEKPLIEIISLDEDIIRTSGEFDFENWLKTDDFNS